MPTKKIRKPAVAGMFYPSNPEKLKREIDLLLEVSPAEIKINDLLGIISPHAGYIYSGRTAAYGFNLLKDKVFKTVIIISPSHREYFPGVSVYDGSGFETPLGIAEVDEAVSERLTDKSKVIFRGSAGQENEHAVEVQIPFLQVMLHNFRIVPVVMGDQGKMFVDDLAEKLSRVADENTLIVASSDLSHYYTESTAEIMDSVVENRVRAFEIAELEEDFNSGRCEACGAGPILALLKCARLKNKRKAYILHRNNSGETSGDYMKVVGYLSAAVCG
ncbi:MAG: AmmeMemoRadiSam system protein B [Ignavibacteria bacterium]